MADANHSIKQTGYQDIDEILCEAHKLLQESDHLQKEIDEAIKSSQTSKKITNINVGHSAINNLER